MQSQSPRSGRSQERRWHLRTQNVRGLPKEREALGQWFTSFRQQGDSPVLGQPNKSGRRELCSALDQRKPADEQLDSPSCEQPDLSDSSYHLDRILVRQCREPGDLLAVVEGLMPQLLLALLSVKAIFIDSMAQPFR